MAVDKVSLNSSHHFFKAPADKESLAQRAIQGRAIDSLWCSITIQISRRKQDIHKFRAEVTQMMIHRWLVSSKRKMAASFKITI